MAEALSEHGFNTVNLHDIVLFATYDIKQIQGNESKDTVTRPEVSEADPSEKQKVTQSELSKLIKENKKSKVNRYAQPNRGKVKKTERHTILIYLFGFGLQTSQESLPKSSLRA